MVLNEVTFVTLQYFWFSIIIIKDKTAMLADITKETEYFVKFHQDGGYGVM